MFHIILCETDAQRNACYAIRRAVFIDEQNVPEEEEWDDFEDACDHFLMLDDTGSIGTARLRDYKGKAKIERVAILKEARGTGAGLALMDHLLAYIEEKNAFTEVVLGAQISALGFYEKCGFEAYGDEFDDAGIPHRMMQRSL